MAVSEAAPAERPIGSGRHICINCGYIYDPVQGDSLNDIPPGTPFEELPPAWVCPMCYAGKDKFDPLD